ncbi:MAG TPA: trimethylamine methyltransferase family protein [Anaerolineae bacterium]|nr:trimethylamine methyltransferase family protein [Anaerolineae bacterium]
MRSNYAIQASPRFGVLTEQQKEEIHSASLEILWRTGTRMYSPEALELLRYAGADVSDGNLVRIPPHLVEWALRTAPPRVILANRNGERSVALEGYKTYYGTGSDCPNILDHETGQRRPYLKADIEKGIRLCDALPNIDFVMSMGLASDVPIKTSDRHQFQAMVLNTVKPIVFTAHDLDGIRDIASMAAAAVGGMDELRRNPTLILYAEPTTPLVHTRESVEKLLFMAENNLPVLYAPGMLRGGTAPVTLAACLAIANAESLTGLLVSQLKREGAPLVLGGGALVMDMRTMVSSYGAPELQLAGAALAEMAHYYGLPRFSSAGASDSKIVDQQAIVEGTISILIQGLSGSNLVHDVGFLECGLTSSYEMLVAMDEVIAMAKQIIKGVEINDDTLALDVIHKVGPGGSFVAESHTAKHFRGVWFPKLLNRQNYDTWAAEGRQTMGDRTRQKVRDLLATHQPQALPAAVVEEIRGVVQKADARLAG